MRAKLIICAFGIFFLFLAILPVVRPGTRVPPADVGSRSEGSTSENATQGIRSSIARTENGSAGREAPTIAVQGPEITHKTDPQTRASELMDLAMKNDSASLATILGELRNPDATIRSTALQAAIQFGSRDAIPVLQQDADQAEDASEKAQILSAIEFLKLPTLSETMAHNIPPGDAKALAQPAH